MTEREYVEHIRSKALAYITEVAKPPGEQMDLKAIEEWETHQGDAVGSYCGGALRYVAWRRGHPAGNRGD
jgi:hypothetical protein